ncbi:MAG: diaminopimelate epimerase [Acidobacteria bacterium]|nr:diaminopimelate epimerase [Acidobacteriota bacterium]
MISFHKFVGLGNDFLILREEELAAVPVPRGQFAARLCDRHFGVGADGVEVLLSGAPPDGADFAIRLHNADGKETPISGNGTRCVAAWLYLIAGWDQPSVRVATAAGIKELILVDSDSADGWVILRMGMGVPGLSSHQVPIVLPEPLEKVVDIPLGFEGIPLRFSACTMGNPHCSIFVDSFDLLDWRLLGRRIELDPRFPDQTNVEFIRVIDRQSIEVRFWERGCGETMSSGTGSCAAVVASVLNGRTDRTVTVHTVAGELLVEWREDGSVWQTGEARYVYRGEWPPPNSRLGRPVGTGTRSLR